MTDTMNEIIKLVIDQGTWRASEWGDKLIEGQFDAVEIDYTHGNLNKLKAYLNTSEGRQAVTSVIASNTCYNDMCDTIEEAVDCWLDANGGELGENALCDKLKELAKSTK